MVVNKWEGIEEFVAVANAGSFVAAASQLSVSTSHVSRAVAALEERLSVQLLARTTRRVNLTNTGKVLAEQFRHLIHERDDALALVSSTQEPHGELRLTCSMGIGERFVVPIVQRYAADHPRLQIHIELTDRVVDIVDEGYDLAIRTGLLGDSNLIATRIASRRLHVCASPGYLATYGRPAVMADLAKHSCLLASTATWSFHIAGQDRNLKPSAHWRCNSGDAVASAAVAGMGICQLPDFYVAEHIRAGRLEVVLDDARRTDEPVWAVYLQKRHLQPKVRLLVDKLRQEMMSALTPLI
jgi:DNA-binding transcriptional LysR family regulator